MKKKLLISLLIILSILLISCENKSEDNSNSAQTSLESIATPFNTTEYIPEEPSLVEEAGQIIEGDVKDNNTPLPSKTPLDTNETISNNNVPSINPSNYKEIEEYKGNIYVTVNNNEPYFTDTDKIRVDAFEYYSQLDDKGRCGEAYANVCIDLMPTGDRENIGMIKPSGWHTIKYAGIVEGNYLYNRCHLIGYQLAGEQGNELNLITGTRYFNTEGMLPFENEVADYVERTNNHVLYRVTPYFEDDNLVANGVFMEAYSVEDQGKGVKFNVFVYNIQPGIEIDYASGDSRLSDDNQMATNDNQVATNDNQTATNDKEQTPSPQPTVEPEPTTEPTQSYECDYILNTNTKVFHYPDCDSVKQMKDKNKQPFIGTKEEAISMGYSPCHNCFHY